MFNWFWDFLYMIQSTILGACDTIRKVFNILIGLEASEGSANGDIVIDFLYSSTVWTVFWWIVAIGFILLVVFMIIAIIRAEMKEESVANKKKYIKTI